MAIKIFRRIEHDIEAHNGMKCVVKTHEGSLPYAGPIVDFINPLKINKTMYEWELTKLIDDLTEIRDFLNAIKVADKLTED